MNRDRQVDVNLDWLVRRDSLEFSYDLVQRCAKIIGPNTLNDDPGTTSIASLIP